MNDKEKRKILKATRALREIADSGKTMNREQLGEILPPKELLYDILNISFEIFGLWNAHIKHLKHKVRANEPLFVKPSYEYKKHEQEVKRCQET